MRRIIFGVIVLIVSVWLGLKLIDDPGLAMFVYHQWSVQMPLWFAIVCFLTFVYVFYGVLRIVDGIEQGLARWKSWVRWRKKFQSYSKTNRGLLELIEGHWRNAENHLLEGIEQSDAPLINYLAAAKAAHERGAFEKRDRYLRMAYELAPQESLAIGIVQVDLQIRQGHYEQALATLNHLRQTAPRQVIVLQYLQRLYLLLDDWKGLIQLLPDLRKANVMSADEYEKLEQKAYSSLLQAVANRGASKQEWKNLWATVPKKLQKNASLVQVYVKHLLIYSDSGVEIEDLINKTIHKGWDAGLVKLYGLLLTPSSQKQLAVAENWLKLYPNQPELFLTLGRMCMRCQLWGKAQHYLEDAIRLDPSPEIHSELGQLNEKLGDMAAAAKHYQRGLGISVD